MNAPAIPDDIGSRWNVVSFERVILNQRMGNFWKRNAKTGQPISHKRAACAMVSFLLTSI
jgi:hypothetical protein